MILYHGTSELTARLALTQGLRPRAQHGGKPNWDRAFIGNPQVIYLTDAYPITYAVEATENADSKCRLAIIEIDGDALNPKQFVPDEDMLAQTIGQQECPHLSLHERGKFYQERLRKYAKLWSNSLQALGTCGYMGAIPPRAIRRIALIDYNVTNAAIMVQNGLDASITLMNYWLVGVKHQCISRWFFGDPPPEMTEEQKFLCGDRIARLLELPRQGIEIISNLPGQPS